MPHLHKAWPAAEPLLRTGKRLSITQLRSTATFAHTPTLNIGVVDRRARLLRWSLKVNASTKAGPHLILLLLRTEVCFEARVTDSTNAHGQPMVHRLLMNNTLQEHTTAPYEIELAEDRQSVRTVQFNTVHRTAITLQ